MNGKENASVGVGRRILSVMEPRDDLPRMPGFMAAVFILLSALSAGAAARLASPANLAEPMASQNIVGLIASLPFLPLAVSLYAATILLWRRIASLLVTPLSFGAMLLFGARFSDAAAMALAILPMAYAFAVSLMAKESRFRRVMTLALFTAGALGIAALARVGVDFGSVESLRDAFMEEVPKLIGGAYQTTFSSSGEGGAAMLANLSLYASARSIFIMIPAYFGVLCVVQAWVSDRIIRRIFLWLNCASLFLDEGGEVTMPVSFAAVYAVVFFVTILIPSSVFPREKVLVQSVLLVMGLPCAAVGIRRIGEKVADSLFYLSRERLFVGMLLFVLFAAVGAYVFLLITSAIGTVSVLRRWYRNRKREDME